MKKVCISFLIGVAALLFFTACNSTVESGGGNSQENNQTESHYNQPEGPVLSSAELSDYLASLEDNTVDTPYEIVLSDANPDKIWCAFEENSNKYLTIYFSKSVTKIVHGWENGTGSIDCFHPNIVSIFIPETVELIEDSVLCCLSSINVHLSNNNFKSINGVLFSKNGDELLKYPPYCKDLVYKLPDNVKKIKSSAFSSCKNLEYVELSSDLAVIESYAFHACKNLSFVNIPKSVNSIGDNAFGGCINLTSINVDELNNNYKSIDGVLFSKNGEEIIVYPQGCTKSTYSIPSGVKIIDEYAFSNCTKLESISFPASLTTLKFAAFEYCSNLTSVVIPKTVTSIPNCAFDNCTSLTSVTIPVNVTSIGNYAFANCTSLTTINYTGTEEQWDVIEKGYSWAYYPVINYNYTGN